MNEKFVILAVDDEPNNLKLLQQILRDTYDLKFARDGTSALAAVEKHNPDLILLDIMMPGMDGYEVCRQLKMSQVTAKIPVIFVTAKTDVQDEEQGLALGAIDYITKPVSPPIVKARLRNHLELKEARDHLEDLVAARTQQLKRKILELEGRDRLVRVQMEGNTLEEAYKKIGLILCQVAGLQKYAFFLPTDAADQLKPYISNEDKLLVYSQEAAEIATSALLKAEIVHDETNDAVAVPFVDKDKVIAVFLGFGLRKDIKLEEQLGMLLRMGLEATMVLRISQATDDILNDSVDLEELMQIGNLEF